MRYHVKSVAGHVEVFDEQGEFLFSADTFQEAQEDLRLLEAA